MAKDKKKTGSTPRNNAAERARGNKNDTANEGSPKPDAGSGTTNQKSDRGRDSEGRLNNDAEEGSPQGGNARGSQSAGSDWDPDRMDDGDMDVRPGKSTPRKR